MTDQEWKLMTNILSAAIAGNEDRVKTIMKQLSVFHRQMLASAAWRISDWNDEIIEERADHEV